MPVLRAAEPARHPSPTVNAIALTHLVFGRPALAQAERFLADFGLVTQSRTAEALYMRAAGPRPYCYRVEASRGARFIGFGLAVGTRENLEAVSRLPGASAISASRHPGGGEVVVLKDPSGFVVEVTCGQQQVEPLPRRAAIAMNTGDAKPRVNATQRPPTTPPEVLQLGHVVLELADFQATCGWYTRNFGFIPSDILLLPDGSPAGVFLRLNLGATPADHHTLTLVQGVAPAFSHAAFEVVDADAVGMGHQVMREAGWQHAWGIGRHILGSQVFDYWKDPWGCKHEHYSDGDLFTEESPAGLHEISRKAMAQWGPPMPRSFTKPRLTPGLVASIAANLRRSPDLSIGKLITLARLFG
jgi:catechol 2,3-dioxygenase-like lactoylglutathione lyase family enzyme